MPKVGGLPGSPGGAGGASAAATRLLELQRWLESEELEDAFEALTQHGFKSLKRLARLTAEDAEALGLSRVVMVCLLEAAAKLGGGDVSGGGGGEQKQGEAAGTGGSGAATAAGEAGEAGEATDAAGGSVGASEEDKAAAQAHKALGNAALVAHNFDEAIAEYGSAIALDAECHVYYSNRSAAHLSKGKGAGGGLSHTGHLYQALDDANTCIALRGDWAKGYSRRGAALHALNRFDEAIRTYFIGLGVDPGNASLKDAANALLGWVQGQGKDESGVAGFDSSRFILHDFMYPLNEGVAEMLELVNSADSIEALSAALKDLSASIASRKVSVTKGEVIMAGKGKRAGAPHLWSKDVAKNFGRAMKSFEGGDAVQAEEKGDELAKTFDVNTWWQDVAFTGKEMVLGIDFGSSHVSAGLYMNMDDGGGNNARYVPVRDDEGRHRIPCKVQFTGQGECRVGEDDGGEGGSGGSGGGGGAALRVESAATLYEQGQSMVDGFRRSMGHSTVKDMRRNPHIPDCPTWTFTQPSVIAGPRDRPM